MSKDSILLAGIILTWFFTSSDRNLRDSSTKALVSLFTNNIDLYNKLIPLFLDVNDVYVLERLFASAFGSVTRSSDDLNIEILARNVFDWIFSKGNPIPHILLRDYAQGIIDRALNIGVELNIDINKIRPPYKSTWPKRLPSMKILEKTYYPRRPDSGYEGIYFSVYDHGDFARYIIGTNHGMFSWSNELLGSIKKPTRKELYDDFYKKLTEKQRKALMDYEKFKSNIDYYMRLDAERRKEVLERTFTDKELEAVILLSEKKFVKLLRGAKRELYVNKIKEYIKNPYIDKRHFDLRLIQRFILNKILKLGWDPKLFLEFDREIGRSDIGRSARKPERIGKKYQWIAYHEALARISDNFKFRDDYALNENPSYEGPWNPHERDIDPTSIIKSTPEGTKNTAWWISVKNLDFLENITGKQWLRQASDLPNPISLIEATDKKGIKYFNLDMFISWDQDIPLGEKKFDYPSRNISYILNSYLVHKKDLNKFIIWAKKTNFYGRWMPETSDSYEGFLREYPWRGIFKAQDGDSYGLSDWSSHEHSIPAHILLTSSGYSKSNSSLDCSIDDSFSINLLCKWIIEKMDLKQTSTDGIFIDNKGEIISYDPSVIEGGPSALLVDRISFEKFLDENKLGILWTLVGEKLIYGGEPSGITKISGAYSLINGQITGRIWSPHIRT